MRLWLLLVPALSLLVVAGCDSSKSTPTEDDPDTTCYPELNGYPCAPYGVQIGDPISNKKLEGYMDGQQTEPSIISLEALYNPTQDETRPRYLWVTGAGLWCVYCKEEAPLREAVCKKMEAQGLACYTVVLQGANSEPAQLSDLDWWRKANREKEWSVDGIAVRDPGYTWGRLLPNESLPANAFVDLKDMTLMSSEVGSPARSAQALEAWVRNQTGLAAP